MGLFRGEIWLNNSTNEPFFVCGVNGSWCWFTSLLYSPYRDGDTAWKKAKVEHFEKKHTFTKHAIAPRSYWKKKATGDIIYISQVKDDGWKKIQIMYEFNKIGLRDFYEFFEPCTRTEALVSMAREKSITKKLKKRIKMTPGRSYDPAE